MKPATFAPTYACVYPELAEIARQHGYALAAHGSMARDFDLVCIPWAETISDPRTVVDAMANRFSLLESGGPPTTKEHGRIAYSLTMARGFGEWCIDLSFMQSHREAIAKKDAALQACVEALEAINKECFSHVDGRDLFAQMHPRNTLDIKRRVDARETWFEGDWLTDLWGQIKKSRAAIQQAEEARK